MDELEFRQRVYANPSAPDQKTLDAAGDNPTYQKILAETQRVENELDSLLSSVVVPDGLKESLLEIPEKENEEEISSVAGKVGSINGASEKPAANAANFFQYYAIAASLLLVIGVTFTLNFSTGPSSADLAMGNEFISHLYHETNEIAAISSGQNLVNVQWNEVNEVMSNAGVRLASTIQTATPVHYANPCIVLPAYSSAHLMLRGDSGTVNVIVVNNSPVDSEFRIQDDRFHGMIVPLDEGNLVLIGEEGENLEQYKELFSENMEWVI